MGTVVGDFVGSAVGETVGSLEGLSVGNVGEVLGKLVGSLVGVPVVSNAFTCIVNDAIKRAISTAPRDVVKGFMADLPEAETPNVFPKERRNEWTD